MASQQFTSLIRKEEYSSPVIFVLIFPPTSTISSIRKFYSMISTPLSTSLIYFRPIIKDKENHLFYFHKHNDLNLVAISKQNNNALMVFTFLHTLVSVLESYFKDAQEESVRDNFVVIYELLDEMMDNGYPQTTETKLLKGFIKTESYELKSPFSNFSKPNNASSIDAAKQISNIVSWRP